jgi:hypothetical protein
MQDSAKSGQRTDLEQISYEMYRSSELIPGGVFVGAVIHNYPDLIAAIRVRLAELERSCLANDAVCGLAEGHTSKIFCGLKNLGVTSLGAILDGIGCRLVLETDPAKAVTAARAAELLGVAKRRTGNVRPLPEGYAKKAPYAPKSRRRRRADPQAAA